MAVSGKKLGVGIHNKTRKGHFQRNARKTIKRKACKKHSKKGVSGKKKKNAKTNELRGEGGVSLSKSKDGYGELSPRKGLLDAAVTDPQRTETTNTEKEKTLGPEPSEERKLAFSFSP